MILTCTFSFYERHYHLTAKVSDIVHYHLTAKVSDIVHVQCSWAWAEPSDCCLGCSTFRRELFARYVRHIHVATRNASVYS